VLFLQHTPRQPFTTYYSGAVSSNVHGRGGYAYGIGTYAEISTTLTPGTLSTTVMSVAVYRYAHDAVFFCRKIRLNIFSAPVVNLPNGR